MVLSPRFRFSPHLTTIIKNKGKKSGLQLYFVITSASPLPLAAFCNGFLRPRPVAHSSFGGWGGAVHAHREACFRSTPWTS
uniref:Uncharacterized protein n=1 Tax=Anguilla anguilla TaxID=7936 RepID=A0A0E9X2H5_ANGAN